MKTSAVDNTLFWKNVKPFPSDKISGKDEIHLLENNELVKADLETAEVLNNFFSNVVQNFDISKISNEEQFINCIEDRTLKAILNTENIQALLLFEINAKIRVVLVLLVLTKKI